MSVFWIWVTAKILVDVLNMFGVLFNLPSSFLGMTLLSFGNSAPGKLLITLDFSLNCALARTGYGEMGIAGSIAGPLFNLLVGLGASMIKNTITSEYV
jgi:sodium/potassium/calcium exchanger 6